MANLAIVIPAYKDMYFDKTLQSIANQTCKDFTLYVGDDSSPYDLKPIVDKYQDRVHLIYKRFDKNYGSKDLVAQWERCIDMVGDENWIWLFSDDDIMEPDCVNDFYKTLNQDSSFDLFHFNVVHIDEDRNIHNKLHEYPEIMSTEEFLKYATNAGYSFVVEYIFRKSHFFNLNRFQHFDLAWFTDTATWIKLGGKNGIRTIPGSNVYFRTSPFSITPNVRDREILKRKFYSQIAFINWICKHVEQNHPNLDLKLIEPELEKWFINTIKGKIKFVQFKLILDLVKSFSASLNSNNSVYLRFTLLSFYKAYRYLVDVFKKIFFWNFFKAVRTKKLNKK